MKIITRLSEGESFFNSLIIFIWRATRQGKRPLIAIDLEKASATRPCFIFKSRNVELQCKLDSGRDFPIPSTSDADSASLPQQPFLLLLPVPSQISRREFISHRLNE